MAYLTVHSDTMEPLYPSGCQLELMPTKIVESGQVYVLETPDGNLIRRVYTGEGPKYELRCDNKAYPVASINKADVKRIWEITAVVERQIPSEIIPLKGQPL